MARGLAIVLVNYASHHLLEQNLDPGVAEAGHMVVVVDNFSSAAERGAVAELTSRRGWELVESATNAGFGDGVNMGVARARELGCDAFLTLNPDAVVSLEVLDELHRAVQADHLALVSPLINRSDGSRYFRGSLLDYRSGRTRGGWEPEPVPGQGTWRPWLTAACLAFHLEAFERLGGFRGEYFLYWEDVDLSRRAIDAGLRLVLRDDLEVVHDEGGTQQAVSARALSGTYYYWNTRNRLLFAAQHLGRRELLRWMLRTPAESRQILLRGGRRQLVQSSTPLVQTAKGSLAGLGVAARALLRPSSASGSAGDLGVETAALGDVLSGRSVLVAHPSPDLYGSDRVMLETVSGLVGAGARVVVALPSDGPLVELVRGRGAEVHFIEMPVLRKSALRPAGFGRLVATAMRSLPRQVSLARRMRADLLLVNTVTIPMWGLVGRLVGAKVLTHVHEAEGSASQGVRRVLYAPLFFSHELVINSQYARRVLVDTYPMLGRRCRVIYNGVPGPDETVGPREQPSPAELLFLGRLSPRKGPDVAIAALAELVIRGVDAKLTLLGAVFPGYEWFERQLHEQVEALGLSGRVEFLGFHPRIWPTMARADIVLVPSIGDEPFGNTAVEAILASRPLVVSDSSGLREASAGFGAVRQVAPADPNAIADGVSDLLRDWTRVREQVALDRADAQRRYGPAVYRAQIAEAAAALVHGGLVGEGEGS